MIVGITGLVGAGRQELINYLQTKYGFRRLEPLGSSPSDAQIEDLVNSVTENWLEHCCIVIANTDVLDALQKRPFFVHVSIDAPTLSRFKRLTSKLGASNQPSLEEFLKDEESTFTFLAECTARADISLINNFKTLQELHSHLDTFDLANAKWLRPSWDEYFMQLAEFASRRSNCMKRRVGCVIVRNNRIIATGYNGTARSVKNCSQGGCPRCNQGVGEGALLSTCLCLHAEENALLEAGRERVGSNSVIYCNTCPCLTCSIKIAQVGIKEVVYSKDYSMDQMSASVLGNAGVKLRKFSSQRQKAFLH